MRLHGIARATLLCVGVWHLPAAAQATTIGPDAFGYTATNEVPFSFVNIQPTGTQVLADVDDTFVNAPIGFDFDFYGTIYNTLFISSNGLLTFGSGNSQFTNTDFTTTAPGADEPTIAPAWDDWITSGDADAVYHQTMGAAGSRQFIVQWNNVRHLGETGQVTFEAILFEASNNILFQYLDMDTGSEATITGRHRLWAFAIRMVI